MKLIKIIILILLLPAISWAEIITDIKVTGNKRISKSTLIIFSEVLKGSDYSEDDLNQTLKKIYDTNFFKKVSLSVENSILNINVIENPIISNVEINGIKSTKLNEFIFEKISLKNRSSFVETKFKNDLTLIKNILKSTGYYFAEIDTKSILNEEQNSIKIIYDINLGKKAKISKIQFLGDKKIKDGKLKNIITSEESKPWKFISRSVYLNYEQIKLDKRLLENYYKDEGYYNVDVTNSFVEFNNEGSFKLIFNINAGEKFSFNKINLALSEDFDNKHFTKINRSLNNLKGKEYSFSKMEKILRQIDKIALSKQYEFINASLSEKIVDNNKLNISITLVETEKFYVEKINILGNEYTLEEVVRNSFIIDEGDAYNEILFNKSINRIKALNIFAKVESKTKTGSNPSYKIIDLTVEEKPTGEISLGAGVGTSGGTIGGGIKENNFMGKGVTLDTNIQFSANNIKGQFTHIAPNFNYTDNTLYSSVYSDTSDYLSDYGYKTSNLGFSFATSFEQYDDFYFKPQIETSYEKLETISTASDAKQKQKGNYFDTYFNYSLDYDQRDKRFRPEAGYRNIFYQELPLVSNTYEIANSFETTKYNKIAGVLTKVGFYGKAINTINNKDVRISKRLYVPESKLRGFEKGRVGPVDKSNDYIGGNYVSTVNFNAAFPALLPSFENTDVSFFIDAANIWGIDYDDTIKEKNTIKSATGLAIDIFTPVGPLNFSLSQPITKNSSDKTETFRFNLGTTF